MVSLKLVFRLLKRRCHASKFLSIGLTMSFDVRLELVGNNLAVIVDIALSRGDVWRFACERYRKHTGRHRTSTTTSSNSIICRYLTRTMCVWSGRASEHGGIVNLVDRRRSSLSRSERYRANLKTRLTTEVPWQNFLNPEFRKKLQTDTNWQTPGTAIVPAARVKRNWIQLLFTVRVSTKGRYLHTIESI